MQLSLARVRSDLVLSRLVGPPGPRGVASALARRAKTLPGGAYFGAALLAVFAGIGFNALVMQRHRHPAPLFAPAAGSAPPAQSSPAAAPAPTSAAPARVPSLPVAVPVPPSDRPSAAGDASSSRRAPDPIADLLRGEPDAEGPRLILAAQNALIRLGYSVKADGAEGTATEEAVRDFERAHGLPVTRDISPRLVKELASAARKAAR